MKKLCTIIVLLSMAFIPLSVFAGSPGPVKLSNTAFVEWSYYNEKNLNFGVFACKTQDCDVNNPSDWFNFSSSSNTGSNGEGSTLLVKPGDTITFLVETVYTQYDVTCPDPELSCAKTDNVVSGDYNYFNPSFALELTNGDSLESMAIFTDGNGDIDQNSNNYQVDPITNIISFSDNLFSGNSPELGIITAKIKEGTPDGTNLGLQLSFDDTQIQQLEVFNPFVSKAYAAEIAQSNVKITVKNTASTVATSTTSVAATPVLPKTGQAKDVNAYALPIGIIMVTIAFIGYQIESRKRKQAK